MGDIEDDIYMVDEQKHDNVIKIGFLNNLQKHEHLLDTYTNAYDIVLLNDGGLEHVTYIIEKLV